MKDSNAKILVQMVEDWYPMAVHYAKDQHNAQDLIQSAALQVMIANPEKITASYFCKSISSAFKNRIKVEARQGQRALESYMAIRNQTEGFSETVNDLMTIMEKVLTERELFVVVKTAEGFNRQEVAEMIGYKDYETVSEIINKVRVKFQTIEELKSYSEGR